MGSVATDTRLSQPERCSRTYTGYIRRTHPPPTRYPSCCHGSKISVLRRDSCSLNFAESTVSFLTFLHRCWRGQGAENFHFIRAPHSRDLCGERGGVETGDEFSSIIGFGRSKISTEWNLGALLKHSACDGNTDDVI